MRKPWALNKESLDKSLVNEQTNFINDEAHLTLKNAVDSRKSAFPTYFHRVRSTITPIKIIDAIISLHEEIRTNYTLRLFIQKILKTEKTFQHEVILNDISRFTIDDQLVSLIN